MDIRQRLTHATQSAGIYRVRYFNRHTQENIEAQTLKIFPEDDRRLAQVLVTQAVALEDVSTPFKHGDPVRLVVDNVSACVFHQDQHYIVVTHQKGHPIVKSMRRIGWRLLKAVLKMQGERLRDPWDDVYPRRKTTVQAQPAPRVIGGERPSGVE